MNSREMLLISPIFLIRMAPKPAAAAGKPAGEDKMNVKGEKDPKRQQREAADSRQTDLDPEPRSFGLPSPGAAAPVMPVACPSGLSLASCQAGLLVPWAPSATPCGFANQYLPCSAKHGTAAWWAQEKWLLCFGGKDPAHAPRHCCGAPCSGPRLCQPPTAVCERRKRECGY